jgi:signal transduction histidine kinase
VPTDLLERIFEPLFTTKDHGTGLGLTICATIASAHEAKLRAGSGPAGGARFTVEFPLATSVSAEVVM